MANPGTERAGQQDQGLFEGQGFLSLFWLEELITSSEGAAKYTSSKPNDIAKVQAANRMYHGASSRKTLVPSAPSFATCWPEKACEEQLRD